VNSVRSGENIKKLLAWLLAMYTPCATSCRHATNCPATNKIPKPVVSSHNFLKPDESARVSRRRAASRVKLLARRISVFAKRMGGKCTLTTRHCRAVRQ